MQDYSQAVAYVETLTRLPVDSAIIDIRLIHDVNKEIPAHSYRGTLPQLWQTILQYQSQSYGAFCNVNALDGNGRELANVSYIRAHLVDLDNLSAATNYEIAQRHVPSPSFAVQSSPGKYHCYWTVNAYQGNDYYTDLQRRLRQLYDGDKSVIDPTRVARLPGTLHLKRPEAPHLVTCWSLAGYGQPLDVTALAASVQHVNVIDSHGGRKPLGEPSLAAPSLDWLRFAMSMINPNDLDRYGWLSVSAAFKQAGWNHASEPELRAIWDAWCASYGADDAGENDKLWNSIRDSETGWKSLHRHAPTLKAYESFGFDRPAPAPVVQQPTTQPMPISAGESEPQQTFGPIVSEHEAKILFKDCYWIDNLGKILTPKGRFMNETKFNGRYMGHAFVYTPDGKTTDSAWKAALGSQLWTIPKVDHIRFLPQELPFSIVKDQLGRDGVNTFIPIKFERRAGDVTPFLRHIELMLPVESDRRTFFDYIAHNVKFPGFKIPWAPLIQSAEGVGKGFIQRAMERLLGEMYTYSPPASELVKSGASFNSWQRNKLFIVVNEIKIDERRELIEIMKPWITDERIQIQSKGVDQEMEDNPANWLFFSNFKDAIPVSQNGRRYAIFYSAIQTAQDLVARGMNDAYFNGLRMWFDTGGHEILCDYLHNYPIERGAIPMRAPDTSSMAEARRVSRGPIDVAIAHAVEDGLTGFRGGYVSVLAVAARIRSLGIRAVSQATICRILEASGYVELGRAPRPYSQESMAERATVYGIMRELPVDQFGRMQGYE